MTNTAVNESTQTQVKSSSFVGLTCRGISMVVGITAVTSIVLLSRPLMSYFSRELCMGMQPQPSYWPNPLSGLMQSAWSRYQCEWMGHWGFNFYEVFSWLTSSWHAILTSVGSCTGIYALVRTMQGQHADRLPMEEMPQQTSADREQLQELVAAIRSGMLPMYQRERTKRASKLRVTQEAHMDTPDTDPSKSFLQRM